MAKEAKELFLLELRERVGSLRSLPKSQSLFESLDGRVRLYIRYSKRHEGKRAFYGLRRQDLQQLEGHRSFFCLIWDEQSEPLIVPFDEYEELFQTLAPASDGQFKCQVFLQPGGAELYIAGAGRFKVESHFGWDELQQAIESQEFVAPALTHSAVQTLLGAIGAAKGFHVWIPQNDRGSLEWSSVARFELATSLPPIYDTVRTIAEQVDVVWLAKGSNQIQALYEVEHSTTIYSGLLRFNDIHLVVPSAQLRFGVVAENIRRARFVRQLNRPTFKASGLNELCSFMEYPEVSRWHSRVSKSAS